LDSDGPMPKWADFGSIRITRDDNDTGSVRLTPVPSRASEDSGPSVPGFFYRDPEAWEVVFIALEKGESTPVMKEDAFRKYKKERGSIFSVFHPPTNSDCSPKESPIKNPDSSLRSASRGATKNKQAGQVKARHRRRSKSLTSLEKEIPDFLKQRRQDFAAKKSNRRDPKLAENGSNTELSKSTSPKSSPQISPRPESPKTSPGESPQISPRGLEKKPSPRTKTERTTTLENTTTTKEPRNRKKLNAATSPRKKTKKERKPLAVAGSPQDPTQEISKSSKPTQRRKMKKKSFGK